MTEIKDVYISLSYKYLNESNLFFEYISMFVMV